MTLTVNQSWMTGDTDTPLFPTKMSQFKPQVTANHTKNLQTKQTFHVLKANKILVTESHASLTFPQALQWWRLLVKENLDPHFMHAGAWESGTHWGAVVPRELQRCTGKAPREPFLPAESVFLGPNSSDASSPPLFLWSWHDSSVESESSVLPVCWVSSTGDDGSPSTASSCSCSFSARSFSSMTESSFSPGLSLRSSNRDSLESLRVEYPKRLSPHTDRVAVTACLIVSVEGGQRERVTDHILAHPSCVLSSNHHDMACTKSCQKMSQIY